LQSKSLSRLGWYAKTHDSLIFVIKNLGYVISLLLITILVSTNYTTIFLLTWACEIKD